MNFSFAGFENMRIR